MTGHFVYSSISGTGITGLNSLETHKKKKKDSFLTGHSPTQYCNCVACVGVYIFIYLSILFPAHFLLKEEKKDGISKVKLTQANEKA